MKPYQNNIQQRGKYETFTKKEQIQETFLWPGMEGPRCKSVATAPVTQTASSHVAAATSPHLSLFQWQLERTMDAVCSTQRIADLQQGGLEQ